MLQPTTLLLFVVLLAAGCGSLSTAPVEVEPRASKSYELGERLSATTGSRILSARRIYATPAYRPVRTFRPARSRYRTDSLHSGQEWTVTHRVTEEEGGYIITCNLCSNSYANSIHISESGRVLKGWVVPGGSHSRIDQGSWPEGQLFERVEGAPQEGSFAFELLYSGRSGGTIRLTYREYYDSLQRSAYAQELSYDLSDSRTISFRSLNLEVLEATNNEITFRILEDGGLEWMGR